MKRTYLLNTATILLFTILIGTPVFYLKQSVYPYTFPKTLFFQFAVEILFAIWLALAIVDVNYRPKRTPLLIAGAAFLGILLLTSLFGVDPSRSFWSTYERMLGVFTLIHLAVLALVISSLYREIPWKKILYASLATAAFVSILAIIQKRIPNLLLNEPIDRPGSTFGNPTFLAGYLAFNILVGFYLFLETFKRSQLKQAGKHLVEKITRTLFIRGSIGALTLLSVVALFFTETRGDLLGLGAALFTLFIIFTFRPPENVGLFSSRRLYFGVILLFLVFGSFFWLTRQNSFWEHVPGLGRFKDISLSLSESNPDLLPRLAAIKAAWKGFLDRPITGWGWDNFNVVYNKYYDPHTLEINYQETKFDKPHNFILEDLVSGGAPLLLARIALFGLFIFEALKRKSLFGSFAVAVLVGFVIRDIFVFDTIGPVLMFYLFAGIVDGEYALRARGASETAHHHNGARVDGGQARLSPYFLIVIGVGVIIAYMINIPSMRAGNYEFLAYNAFVNGHPDKGVAYFDDARAAAGPYAWNFTRDFAKAVSEAYFYNPGAVKKEDAARAIHEMEKVAEEHPQDAYNHYSLVDFYNQTSDIDPKTFLDAADREAQIALTLSPNRQEVYFSMAKTKAIRGDYAGAIVVLKKALDLDPKVADAHFYYGLLLSANKDLAGGYAELKTAIALGKTWKNYYEPRTVADFFAAAGHTDEAIDLYRVAVQMSTTDDSETRLKVADFLMDAGPEHFAEATVLYQGLINIAPANLDTIVYYPLSLGEAKLNSGIVYSRKTGVVERTFFDDAIGFYNVVLSLDPNNLVATVEIGVAYYFEDDAANAQKYLSKAAIRPDFQNSSLFTSVKPIFDQLGIKTGSE